MRFSFRVMPSSFRRLTLIRGCIQMSISLWQQIDNFYKFYWTICRNPRKNAAFAYAISKLHEAFNDYFF